MVVKGVVRRLLAIGLEICDWWNFEESTGLGTGSKGIIALEKVSGFSKYEKESLVTALPSCNAVLRISSKICSTQLPRILLLINIES